MDTIAKLGITFITIGALVFWNNDSPSNNQNPQTSEEHIVQIGEFSYLSFKNEEKTIGSGAVADTITWIGANSSQY